MWKRKVLQFHSPALDLVTWHSTWMTSLPTRNWLLSDKLTTRNLSTFQQMFDWHLTNALSKSGHLSNKAKVVIFLSFWQVLDNAVACSSFFSECAFSLRYFSLLYKVNACLWSSTPAFYFKVKRNKLDSMRFCYIFLILKVTCLPQQVL